MDAAASSLSLFHYLVTTFGEQVDIVPSTKAILVHLSHAIEDIMLCRQLPALLFAGFQNGSRWYEEAQRYGELAGIAQHVCIFAASRADCQGDLCRACCG